MTGHANFAKIKNRIPKPMSIQKINPKEGVMSFIKKFHQGVQKYKNSPKIQNQILIKKFLKFLLRDE